MKYEKEAKMKFSLKVFVIMVLVWGTALATNGTYLHGFSALTMGRGGLSYGFYDSPLLMMNHPAALAQMNPNFLEADMSLMFPKLHFRNSLNDTDGESSTFPLLQVAYGSQFGSSSWFWGFGVFTQGGMGADFSLKHALFPEKVEYHSQFGVMEVGPSLAFRGENGMSLGFSVHLLYGQMEMWMPYSLSPEIMRGQAMPGLTFGQMFAAPPDQGGLGYQEVTAYAEMKGLNGFGYNGTISFAYRVNDKLSIGTAFTSAATLKLRNGDAKMNMTDQFNDAFQKMTVGALMQMGIDPNQATPDQWQAAQQAVMGQLGQMGIDMQTGMNGEYTVETDLKVPARLGAGLRYRTGEFLTLGVDLEYIAWSGAFDKMPLHFTGGTNSNINTMMGSENMDLDFPLKWEDTYVVKLGAEMNFSEMFTGRLGFVHGTNPVPSETLIPIFPAIVENHLMAGGTIRFSSRFALHAAYEMALNNSQTVSRSEIAREYDGSTSELMEHFVHLSFAVRF